MISLILGLGNPGKKYADTRHNLGFELIERLRDATKIKSRFVEQHYVEYLADVGNRSIVLAQPMTFMNRSGRAAMDLLQQHSLEPGNMLVIVDDFSLPLGTIRMRSGGSDGGHNGLASIIEWLGSDQFPRLRLGIGPAPESIDTADFVLDRFIPAEQEAVNQMLGLASEAVLFAVSHRLELAMSKFNRPPALPEQE